MRKRQRHFKGGLRQPPASGCQPSHTLTQREVNKSAEELAAFHRRFANVFQRREQRYWSMIYLCGQLAELARKTIEPMALALLGAKGVRALQRHISQSRWSAERLIEEIQALVGEWLGDRNGIVVVDGSGFPKQGKGSVGVAHQYCGHLGKVANCQEGVFLIYVGPRGFAFLDERLYVPESWFTLQASQRRAACGIPVELTFQTKPALGLEMIRSLVARNRVPFRWVMGDSHFGQNPGFLQGVSQLGKWYMVEIPADTRFWTRRPRIEPPGPGLLGRPRLHPRVSKSAPTPQAISDLAAQLPRSAWTSHIIKEAGKGPLAAEFAFLRLVTIENELPGDRRWVILRRTLHQPVELKCYLSNAPTDCARSTFVRLSGMRWPIETAFEEAKGEVGLDHYETRTWLGWHHHMAQMFMAHLFLIRLRLLFKKKFRTHHGSGSRSGCPSHRRRVPSRTRCHSNHSVSSATQPCCLLLASQADAQTASPPQAYPLITRSVVVM